MALPSRPNARLNGLPSGPAAARSRPSAPQATRSQQRSASVTRDYSRDESSTSQPPSQLRYQRSVGHLSTGSDSSRLRGRAWERDAPPLPPLPDARPTRTTNAASRLRSDRKGSDASSTSSSSSGGSASGYSTPATSVDEYEQEKYFEDEMQEEQEKPTPPGFGSSLWSRLASAAGSLTINVNKAWEGGHSSGEVTPPGGESRITRALKAYHIAQASKPSDLPEWLFDEKERGVTARLQPTESGLSDESRSTPSKEPSRMPMPPPMPVKSSINATTNSRPDYKKAYADDDDRAAMSRATQRLKQLRDAKAIPRQQTIKFADAPRPRRFAEERSDVQEQQAVPNVQPLPAARNVGFSVKRPAVQGLPSGVRPRRT